MPDTPDPRPPVAVIAGATGNVGGAAAMALARRGFQVVMLGRDLARLQDKARAKDAALRAQDPEMPGAFLPMEVDLTDLASLKTVAQRITDRFGAVDVLVLSAVTYRQDGPTILPDGNELMFSTNVLGQFRLAALLRPALDAAQGVVVHVVAPFKRRIDWEDLQSKHTHRPMEAYERSKACHRIMAIEMSRRFGGGVTSFAFDPGFVIDRDDPDLARRWPLGLTGWFWRAFAAMAAKPPAVAGEAMAKLLTWSDGREALNGGYFKLDRKSAFPDPAMGDPEIRAKLWDSLDRLAFPDGQGAEHPAADGP